MENLVQAMRVVLGTAFSLYVKTHAFHWNVTGPDFAQLHGLFGEQYEEVWGSLDEIAEHLRTLDAYAPMSMERFIALSRVQSAAPAPIPAAEMVAEMMRDHETMRDVLKEAVNAAKDADDEGMINFLGGRLEAHAKHRWMLRATSKA